MATVRKRTWGSAADVQSAWVVDWLDQAGRRHRKQFSTKKQADAFRIDVEGKLQAGSFRADGDKVTVSGLCNSFLEYCYKRKCRGEGMTRATLEGYRTHVRSYICITPDSDRPPRLKHTMASGIGHIKLSHLTSRVIGDFRDRLRDGGASVPMTRKVLVTLHTILMYAKSQDLVAFNAAADIRVIGRRDEGSTKIIPPTKVLFRELLSTCPPNLRMRVKFAALTGLRAGEMHALRWENVNLISGSVAVRSRVDKWGEEDGQGAKTRAGNRTVPMGETLRRELIEWRKASPFSADGDLVFPSLSGEYQSHRSMMRWQFKPALERLTAQFSDNVEMRQMCSELRWHSLRHFAISLWIYAKIHPKTVQTYAGHSSLQVTMDRYGHLFEEIDDRDVLEKIAQNVD